MHAVSAAEQRDVDVVVDDEQRFPGNPAEVPRQREQFAARQRLVPQLNGVGAAADGGLRELEDALPCGVGRDDVEPGCPELQERIWRSLSRNALGAVSQSHECFTTRFRCSWNS